jgi:hypothetical protein
MIHGARLALLSSGKSLRITKGKQMPPKGKSVVRKAGGAIARTAKKVASTAGKVASKAGKVTAKLKPRKRAEAKVAEPPLTRAAKPKRTPAPARTVQRQSDVPLDLIAATYSPSQTSTKVAFRSDGSERLDDQELPVDLRGRWQDEDHYTNKSGDARIGTHGRSDEPGEKRR